MVNPFALLVEDESPKLAHIFRFMQEEFPDVRVKRALSVSSAIEAIDDGKCGLLLLDMSLPTFDVGPGETGGRPQGFGGVEILRYIDMSGLNLPTIVITGYEAFPDETGEIIDLDTLRCRLVDEFPSTVKDVVHFNSSLEGWKGSLREAVSAILRSTNIG